MFRRVLFRRMEALADCDVVFEAIVEKREAKKAVFAQLDWLCGPDTILASNTSSLSVTEIAAACENKGRVAGLHYFNPVPLMKLVEVVDAVATEQWVGDALMVLGERQDRKSTRLKSSH